MAFDRESTFAPFGWVLASSGPRPQVDQELTSLRGWLEHTWRGYFPAPQGYRVGLRRPDGGAGQLQLTVDRGDFRAEVAIEGGAGSDGLRMFGTARSATIVASKAQARRIVSRARAAGAATGLLVFAGVCVAVVGRYEPHYPLSGMLMVVMLLFSLVAGGAIGSWVTERLAERRCRRAQARASGDAQLQHDLRRWRSLSRLLAQQRDVIASRRRRQPFRSEA